MKRTLSLVLALIMVLGSFTTVFAAEATVEETAAKFLEKEGVLLGNDDGDLMLNKDLERRDAVVLLSRLLGVEDEAAEFLTTEASPSWEDARTDAYYVPFFAWAEENGYFEGDDEDNFNPRSAITAQEYALVLLRALDYDVKGHDAWKAALETAEELGLLKDVEVEDKDEVVRGQMAVMTFNALGTKMNDSDETLAEKLGIEMPEDPKAKELTAEVNDTVNLAEVVVELSNAELADEVRLENASNYTLSGSRTVKSAEIIGDDVVLLLDDALVRNREYTLTIRGIDRAINGDYKFKAYDNTVPTVESVEVLGEYGIKVTTSEPVQKPLERNILIDGSRTSMIVEQYGRDIILRPYHDRAFDKNASELTILELEDYAGFKSTSIKEDIEIIKDEIAPEIVSATMTAKTVTVEFDKDVYQPSVKAYANSRNLGNTSYAERRITIYAETAEKVGTNKVKYTFKADLPRNVELTIEGVQNHSKVTMEKRTDVAPVLVSNDTDAVITNNANRLKVEVAQDNYAKVRPELGDVKETVYQYTGLAELTIKFDKELSEDFIDDLNDGTLDFEDYFTIYEKDLNNRGERAAKNDGIAIEKAALDKTGKELTLFIENLMVNNKNKDYDYILEVVDLEDVDGNETFRDFVDFEVAFKGSGFKINTVKVVDSRYRNSVEIVITFNEPVDRDAALDARNYFIDGEDLDELDGEAIVEGNGRTVSLVIPEKYEDFANDYDGKPFEVLKRVTDKDGNRFNDGEFVFEVEKDAEGRITDILVK